MGRERAPNWFYRLTLWQKIARQKCENNKKWQLSLVVSQPKMVSNSLKIDFALRSDIRIQKNSWCEMKRQNIKSNQYHLDILSQTDWTLNNPINSNLKHILVNLWAKNTLCFVSKQMLNENAFSVAFSV